LDGRVPGFGGNLSESAINAALCGRLAIKPVAKPEIIRKTKFDGCCQTIFFGAKEQAPRTQPDELLLGISALTVSAHARS
jgi:hypothetical protein